MSMSMSMHNPSLTARSTRILSSILKMSGPSSAQPAGGLCESPDQRLAQQSNLSLVNSSILNQSNNFGATKSYTTSRSLYSISDTNKQTSISKLVNSKIISGGGFSFNGAPSDSSKLLNFEYDNVNEWTGTMIKMWLSSIGMLPVQIKNALKHIRNGKALVNLSDGELEKMFLITNSLHKRKLKLAIDDLKYPEKWFVCFHFVIMKLELKVLQNYKFNCFLNFMQQIQEA